MTKILLVEDDRSIIAHLTTFLHKEGYTVISVDGQAEAIGKLQAETFDLVLLDVSLAEGNGFAVCAAAKNLSDVPVIFLTASGDEYSVVTGLDMGADDYISKPFRPRELLSRIRSVLRRGGRTAPALELGDLRVDPAKGLVTKQGCELFLSALEYRLLLIFLQNKGVVLTRARLLEELWDMAGEFVNDNTLTVYIKRLREKIENDPSNPVRIRTIRGLGYKAGD